MCVYIMSVQNHSSYGLSGLCQRPKNFVALEHLAVAPSCTYYLVEVCDQLVFITLTANQGAAFPQHGVRNMLMMSVTKPSCWICLDSEHAELSIHITVEVWISSYTHKKDCV